MVYLVILLSGLFVCVVCFFTFRTTTKNQENIYNSIDELKSELEYIQKHWQVTDNHSKECGTYQPCEKESPRQAVSIHYDENGNADGVLVQTLDQSFILDLHDAEDGNQMNWRDAMKEYKMPIIQQWLLVMVYKDEVNKCLREAGGEELKTADCYWSSSECSSNYAWYVVFSGFNSYGGSKNFRYSVRKIK